MYFFIIIVYNVKVLKPDKSRSQIVIQNLNVSCYDDKRDTSIVHTNVSLEFILRLKVN